MDRIPQIRFLIDRLLDDMPQYRKGMTLPGDERELRRLLRGLMNVRPPMPLKEDFLAVQDALLSAEREEKGIVRVDSLQPVRQDERFILWQGDITRLDADAIVNAANSQLLGCFHPCHGCIDNAIHSAAGLQLREACRRIMDEQGHEEGTGQSKMTDAYNLPCRHVLHTVGPIVSDELTPRHEAELASCYRSCLELADAHGLESVAFCCISTGEFRFPNAEAARIAVDTVREHLQGPSSIQKVIFNVFKDIDAHIYRSILAG